MLFEMTFLTTFISIIKLYNQILQNYKYLMTSSRKNTLKTPLRVAKLLGSGHFLLFSGLNFSKKSKSSCPQNLQETLHFWTLAAPLPHLPQSLFLIHTSVIMRLQMWGASHLEIWWIRKEINSTHWILLNCI